MQSATVFLVVIAVAIAAILGLPHITGALDATETATTGVPTQLQAAVGFFRETVGYFILVVFIMLFVGSLGLFAFRKRNN